MAVTTKAKGGREDLQFYDGKSKTFTRLDSSGGTQTITKINNFVDVLQVYGSGSNYTVGTLDSAIKAVGSSNVDLFLSAGNWVIDSNFTFPSTVNLILEHGCYFTISSSITLTLNCPLQRTRFNTFRGDGSYSLSEATKNSLPIVEHSTTATAQADTTLIIGEVVRRKEYATGKGIIDALSDVVAAGTGTADGCQYHNDTIDGSTFQLQLRPPDILNVKVGGAYGDESNDDTAEIQAAFDYAYSIGVPVFAPVGVYIVTGVRIPGRTTPSDDRDKPFRLIGAGTGEAFALSDDRSTIFRSTTDAPVLYDYQDTSTASNGSVEVGFIRLEGTSTTPVLRLDSALGMHYYHDIVIYQQGTGDGVYVGHGASTELARIFAINGDWATSVVGASRTGVGINIEPVVDMGLCTVYKCTGRGFLTAHRVSSDGGGNPISTKFDQCQASTTYNGFDIDGAVGAVVDACFMEGGDQGTGIIDAGNYTNVINTRVGSGYTVGIDSSDTSLKGNRYVGNQISLAAVANAIAIKLSSSASFGGYSKAAISNFIARTQGTSGQIGIQITGTDPRLDYFNNAFDPKTAWTGTSAAKIDDQSNGTYGISIFEYGNYEIPFLSRGGFSLFRGATALTESDVSSNVLTVPEGINYIKMTATVSTTVNSFASTGRDCVRYVMINTTNANTTFADTASIETDAAASFNSKGLITFVISDNGTSAFAQEISRVTFT